MSAPPVSSLMYESSHWMWALRTSSSHTTRSARRWACARRGHRGAGPIVPRNPTRKSDDMNTCTMDARKLSLTDSAH
jgi:hypothetical protein